MFEFATIPAVAAICYFVGYCVKQLINKEDVDRFIPVITGTLGAILGAVIFKVYPDMIAANDYFTAIAIGIASGFAATGVNQIYKQLKKN